MEIAQQQQSYHAMSQPVSPNLQRRGGLDWTTILTLFFTWAALVGGGVSLLISSYKTETSYSGSPSEYADEVIFLEALTIVAWSAAPLIIAAFLNEVVVERCWRRIAYLALGSAENGSNEELAENLRAANLRLPSFVWQLITFQARGRELTSAFSWLLVRLGTAVAIASAQLSVSWVQSGSNQQFHPQRQWEWVVLPVVIHAVCVFGSFLIWFERPWTFFSNRFDDAGLLGRYLPYLTKVQGGSLADVEEVIEHLVHGGTLSKQLKTGIQFGAKFSGMWLGTFLMFITTGFYVIWRYTSTDQSFAFGPVRFGIQLIFLVENIFYLMALDFVVWNISLDGFCRTKTGAPKRGLRCLGYSSGIVLLYKTVTQRRPIRAIIFFILFWLQAVVFRLMTTAFAFCPIGFAGFFNTRYTGFDLFLVWIDIFFLTFVIVIPLFILWMFIPTSAPVSRPDGWKWAQIAKDALYARGYYGIDNGTAAWGADVAPFVDHRGEVVR